MPWALLVWLLAFILQSTMLGLVMFQVVQITDLQADFINPHDAAANYNRVVLPQYGVQTALAVLLLTTGNWFSGILQTLLLIHMLNQYRLGRHLADVTEMFREASSRKKEALIKLGCTLAGFVWTIYHFIRVIVVGVLSTGGRKAAGKLLKEAAASLY